MPRSRISSGVAIAWSFPRVIFRRHAAPLSAFEVGIILAARTTSSKSGLSGDLDPDPYIAQAQADLSADCCGTNGIAANERLGRIRLRPRQECASRFLPVRSIEDGHGEGFDVDVGDTAKVSHPELRVQTSSLRPSGSIVRHGANGAYQAPPCCPFAAYRRVPFLPTLEHIRPSAVIRAQQPLGVERRLAASRPTGLGPGNCMVCLEVS